MSNYKKYGIYKITNIKNGKVYVGKTMNSFGDRWDHHKARLRFGKHDNHELQNDWNVFGEENFEFEIIYDCTGKSLQEVNNLEISEIAKYKNLNLAYNIHDGGDIGLYLGKHLSEEAKRKIGEKNKVNMTGRKASEETKRKMSESQKKRFESMSDEEKATWGNLMSERARGYKWSDDSKDKMKNNKNGATVTVDQVRYIRKLREQNGLGYSEISNITGIKRHAVYLIATYRRWKDVS